MEFKHTSIMLSECIDGLNIKEDGIYIDATLGGGGHSLEICKKLSEKGMLIGIDRDQEAIEAAKERLSETVCQKKFINANFCDIDNYIDFKADGILADLGVSSYQLDNKDRGFTYREDAPLDMRMDKNAALTAEIVVNTYSFGDLYRIISQYGEEKYAKSIASNIVKKRETEKITTTNQLIDIIRHSMPFKSTKEKHPAKRTFQAIRIEVNDELGSLKSGIEKFFNMLNHGGRLCLITFHSGEDKIVKSYFKSLYDVCTCNKDFPVCICNNIPSAKPITRKAIVANERETEENPRSKSAKLRITERL